MVSIIMFLDHALTSVRLYDERLPLEPAYPAIKPSEGDLVSMQTNGFRRRSRNRRDEDRITDQLHHAPPGWESDTRASTLVRG